jgi:transglutaminase-like putative cysteine protease
VLPRFDAERLEAAPSTTAGDPIYTQLPDDVPASIRQVAGEFTEDATTPYDTALALQNWFREEFTYSLEVQPGHGNVAMEAFLANRVGYSEQFAGTYAVMLRTLGIPTRVAVGFTAGAETNDQEFSVRGSNAHAWPEVWFDGLGWVPFEPTPGRSAPGAENHTGVAAP